MRADPSTRAVIVQVIKDPDFELLSWLYWTQIEHDVMIILEVASNIAYI